MTIRTITVAAAGLSLSLPSVVAAQAPASDGARVQLRVPEYCEISASPILIEETQGRTSGSIFESCNVQEGFQVVATHRELRLEESVAVNYDGIPAQLSRSGTSLVANRIGAKFGNRLLAFDYRRLEAPLIINLTITNF